MHPKRLALMLASVAIIASVGVFHGIANAKGKPGGGNPPVGEIYFEAYISEVQDFRLVVMNPDGTNKTVLPATVPSNSRPSYDIHNGGRWHLAFTETPGQVHPDGQPRGILEAVREDGNARATLLSDSDMWYNHHFTWSKDDQWISFTGYRWDDSVSPPVPVDAGLYILPIGFDGDGPFALANTFKVAESGFQNSNTTKTFTEIASHDWSPDGSRIVWQRYSDTLGSDVFISDLETGNVSFLVDAGWEPSWSPDGQQIAFSSAVFGRNGQVRKNTIEKIDVNGSNRQIVYEISALKGFTLRDVRQPHWSPTGDHIAFKYLQLGGDSHKAIYRVTADGRDVQDLTEEFLDENLLGWR